MSSVDPSAARPVLLALDTATEVAHLALSVGERVHTAEVAGGAQASRTALPALQALLAEAALGWDEVDAIAFGRGPGAFTGLRTACSIAQGLALAASCPVIALDTLMAVAEDARQGALHPWVDGASVWVAQDARMNELYVAAYRWDGLCWHAQGAPQLWPVDLARERWAAAASADTPSAAGMLTAPFRHLAGSALLAHPVLLQGQQAATAHPQAAPRGAALAALARQAWRRGEVLDAALALPLYVREKVAQTTAERLAVRSA